MSNQIRRFCLLACAVGLLFPAAYAQAAISTASETLWAAVRPPVPLFHHGVRSSYILEQSQPQSSPLSPASGGSAPPRQGGKPLQNPKHIFLVVPSYDVTYFHNAPPLRPEEKFEEFKEDTYDPVGLTFSAFEALVLEHSSKDGFCGYGSEIGGYSKCFGSALLDANVSGFFGDYLFSTWLHQDPRYFRLGPPASVPRRIVYALSRVVFTRSDVSRRRVLDTSQLGGTLLAGVVSNLYYPKSDRGLGLTMSRIAIDLGATAGFNLEAEFWQDIKSKIWKPHYNQP